MEPRLQSKKISASGGARVRNRWISGQALYILSNQGSYGTEKRKKKRWDNNIKEWTGMNFASTTRTVENPDGQVLLKVI